MPSEPRRTVGKRVGLVAAVVLLVLLAVVVARTCCVAPSGTGPDDTGPDLGRDAGRDPDAGRAPRRRSLSVPFAESVRAATPDARWDDSPAARSLGLDSLAPTVRDGVARRDLSPVDGDFLSPWLEPYPVDAPGDVCLDLAYLCDCAPACDCGARLQVDVEARFAADGGRVELRHAGGGRRDRAPTLRATLALPRIDDGRPGSGDRLPRPVGRLRLLIEAPGLRDAHVRRVSLIDERGVYAQVLRVEAQGPVALTASQSLLDLPLSATDDGTFLLGDRREKLLPSEARRHVTRDGVVYVLELCEAHEARLVRPDDTEEQRTHVTLTSIRAPGGRPGPLDPDGAAETVEE